MKIKRELPVEAVRGNIYDSEGRLLAYNELAYSVTIRDNDSFTSTSERNLSINERLAKVITAAIENNETIDTNSFGISYNPDDSFSFNVTGNALKRFLADVFGKSSYDNLVYNKTFKFNEASATADQVMEYMMHDRNHYGLNLEPTQSNPNPPQYSKQVCYYIVAIRYAMSQNYYTRYMATTIIKNASTAMVAYVNEHSDELEGISIDESTIRKYDYSEYLSNIIGYTGTISESEYQELSQTDETYTKSDIIGRSGLEQYYESYLRGTNGEQSVYIDNLGRISEVISKTDATAGNNLYLTIDVELQKATYLLLEQEIAGIVYSNIKSGNIKIEDVYYALINNSVIDLTHFSAEDASANEQQIYTVFSSKLSSVTALLRDELDAVDAAALNSLPEESLDYFTYVINMLKRDNILKSKDIDTENATYVAWKNGDISPQKYLKECIANQWIDITALEVDEKYADTNEIYQALVNHIVAKVETETDFSKIIYRYLVQDGSVSGKELCLILFDQGVLDYDDATVSALESGSTSPYSFLMNKIDNIEITPAQLALDPCTGSCIITDVNTGAVKAMVSYPGYDNNRMANGVDAKYYAKLQSDKSNPLYNNATQEKTACGSTFKMVTAVASLAEGVISTGSQIDCTGVFTEVDNQPKCWIYPSNHGSLNVSEALRDSCNVFFYTCGYNLSNLDYGTYDDKSGIAYINKYATLFGLDRLTGLEIEENMPEIATEYPVMAAIGQSNNNYTTASLSRYVTAVASQKVYDYQLMGKITDTDGNIIKSYEPEYTSISDTLPADQWQSVYSGMRMVCEELENFSGFTIPVAGKTGTAQQVLTRPNHALFVGYAPYDNPQISIACRIAYGYTSHNAAGASRNILSYYFGVDQLDSILAQKASGVNTSSSNALTD